MYLESRVEQYDLHSFAEWFPRILQVEQLCRALYEGTDAAERTRAHQVQLCSVNDARAMSEIDPASETTKKQQKLFNPRTFCTTDATQNHFKFGTTGNPSQNVDVAAISRKCGENWEKRCHVEKLKKPEGALVASVGQNSPADKAGIRAGDIILG